MNKYTIIEADVDKNKNDIIPILKRNLREASAQRYEWNYKKCPFGLARFFLAKHDNSKSFVGTASLFPRKINIENEPNFAYIAGDFAVDKKHRAYGPALKLQKDVLSESKNSGFKFIYGFPNEKSKILLLKAGYQEIGNIKLFIKIIKTKYIHIDFISIYLNSTVILKVVKYIKSFKMFSKVLDLIIKKFSKEERNKKKYDYSVEMPELFDNRFDIFWKEVSKQYKIIGVRDSIFLNWRYKQSPSQEYKIFCILDENKKILGYIIYYIKEKICYIVDMLFFKSKNVLDALLTEFCLHIRKKSVGAINIRYLGDMFLENKLKEYNFFPIENNKTKVLIHNFGFIPQEFLLDKKNWHFFIGDTDL
jgi:hypothetical protein